ncbi:hypothetical protein ACJMK2_009913 [Sinanodonta woodiana]|uniref:5' nucleotidase n=1 Tax=Sinanodonta woodiana TaxID=1069815 RepID=A0ABD3VGP3_SINWO
MGDSTLTIIHFNDVYNIEPQTIEPVGGAARMARYIHSCQDIGLNPLVLFSGDALNPSIMSIFLKGEQMIPILNLLGVHCAVLGNHDFDFGVDHLEDVMTQTNFPWLMSNVYDNLTGFPLARCENKYITEWNGIKIGLIGLVEEEWIATLATLDPEDVTFRDYVDEGRRLAKELKEDGAELVIALTHMRWPNDRRLAESVAEIDIILAGHDHDYNVELVNGKYIIKSGTDFRNLSKITITLNHSGMMVVDVQRVDLDSSIEEDPDVKESVNHIRGDIDLKMDEELGTMAVEMDGRFSSIRTQETNLGNFVTDIILEACPADCCILNSGTFRSDRIHKKGVFRLRDLLTILPLVDPLCVIKVSGEGILKALENGVSQYPSLEGRFPQVAGIKFGFDPSKPRGQRVEKDLVQIQDEYLQLNKEYRLCTKEYIAAGKDGYDVFRDCEILVTSEQCPTISTAVRNHFESVQMYQGVKPCRSGHRQSLVSLVRRESLVRQASVDHLNLSHALVRQMSVHNVEEEQCYLAPTVEGRIFLLDDEKRQIQLKSKIPYSHNVIDEIIRENSKEHESMDSTEGVQLMEATTSDST